MHLGLMAQYRAACSARSDRVFIAAPRGDYCSPTASKWPSCKGFSDGSERPTRWEAGERGAWGAPKKKLGIFLGTKGKKTL